MDGAWPGAFDLALGKAQTARSFQIPSSALAPMIQPGEPLFAVNTVCGGRYVILGGGIPIGVDGDVVGAVGVSGGAVEEDVVVAAAAAATLTVKPYEV